MATPVKDIFEPRLDSIRLGSFLKGGDNIYFIGQSQGGQYAHLYDLGNGLVYFGRVTPRNWQHFSKEEMQQLLDETDSTGWSVLSRAEAATELSKMK